MRAFGAASNTNSPLSQARTPSGPSKRMITVRERVLWIFLVTYQATLPSAKRAAVPSRQACFFVHDNFSVRWRRRLLPDESPL